MTPNGWGMARGQAPRAFLFTVKLAKSEQAISHELYRCWATLFIFFQDFEQ